MRRFYKTSLISALVCILFFNEGAASAFEFKNPFKKKNKSNVQKLKDKNSKIQESTEEAAPAIYTQSEEEYIDDTDAIHIRDI